MLSQLIYASDITEGGLAGGVLSIVDAAREKNAAADVTGVLVYDNNCFLQCLEGSREQVTDTYFRIAVDPRHRNITLIAFSDIEARDFPDWTMGYLGISALTREVLRRYRPDGQLAPREMSATSVIAMLKTLRSMDRVV